MQTKEEYIELENIFWEAKITVWDIVWSYCLLFSDRLTPLSHIQPICSRRLWKYPVEDIYEWKDVFIIELKTLWENVKLLLSK